MKNPTGAELLSMVQPADENKTFSVVFRTPPENSNGIAHVLEHSVLCGSRKYPVKAGAAVVFGTGGRSGKAWGWGMTGNRGCTMIYGDLQ